MRRRQILAARISQPKMVKAPTLEELKARYAVKFGKPPHWKMKPETIKERLDGTV